VPAGGIELEDDGSIGVLVDGLVLGVTALPDVLGLGGGEPDLGLDRLVPDQIEGGGEPFLRVEVLRVLEGVLGEVQILDALHGEDTDVVVLGDADKEVEPALAFEEVQWLDQVGFLGVVVKGQVADPAHFVVQDGPGQVVDDRLLAGVILGHPVGADEKGPEPGDVLLEVLGEELVELAEGAADRGLDVSALVGLHGRPQKVERNELGRGEVEIRDGDVRELRDKGVLELKDLHPFVVRVPFFTDGEVQVLDGPDQPGHARPVPPEDLLELMNGHPAPPAEGVDGPEEFFEVLSAHGGPQEVVFTSSWHESERISTEHASSPVFQSSCASESKVNFKQGETLFIIGMQFQFHPIQNSKFCKIKHKKKKNYTFGKRTS
jgi:hypothetical protein